MHSPSSTTHCLNNILDSRFVVQSLLTPTHPMPPQKTANFCKSQDPSWRWLGGLAHAHPWLCYWLMISQCFMWPSTACTNNWTHSAASRHTTTPVSQTNFHPFRPQATTHSCQTEGRGLRKLEHTVG